MAIYDPSTPNSCDHLEAPRARIAVGRAAGDHSASSAPPDPLTIAKAGGKRYSSNRCREEQEEIVSAHISNVRPKADKVPDLIADYVKNYA
jgi:hypothetical protein